MDECAVRRMVVAAHWHGGMRTGREVMVKDRRADTGGDEKFMER